MTFPSSRKPSSLAQDEAMPTLVITHSTELLEKTARACEAALSQPTPALEREKHVVFLEEFGLKDLLPRGFVSLDASRPWMMYWVLCALKMLGQDITPHRQRAVSSLKACQHPEGGFGGGHGQLAHLAPTYAAVNTLALFGGEDAFKVIDRDNLYKWMMSLKQPDGGFLMHHGGEEDARYPPFPAVSFRVSVNGRSAYTALAVATLLNLRTEEFVKGTAEWLVRCQTFEGGMAGSPLSAEAHGGYAFCILAALCILYPPTELGKHVDMDRLIVSLTPRLAEADEQRWVAMQQAPEGGFAGRTNKLVDACYSWWVGGCWALIEASENRTPTSQPIWNRQALAKYLLSCCQHPHGGLRDKPPMNSDFYHTLYSLAGLSATQHHYTYDAETQCGEEDDQAFKWIVDATTIEGEEADRLGTCHPVFVLPWGDAERIRRWFVRHDREIDRSDQATLAEKLNNVEV